jgi:hypothetical protein
MDLIGIEHHEVGPKMTELGCADRIERIIALLDWAQRRALADRDARELALDRMVADAESLDLYISKENENA